MIELRRILVPTDFSKHSESALSYALAFVEKFGARLYLLHVVQDLAVLIPDMITVSPPIAPTVSQLTEAVQQAFNQLIADHHLQAWNISREVREGAPFFEIIRFAKDTQID